MQVTLWYRVQEGKRKYNHLQYGWGAEVVPIGMDASQNKIWKGVVWDKVMCFGKQIPGQSLVVEK